MIKRNRISRAVKGARGGTLDNRYRRDHQMAYYTDESVVKEQLILKKIIREYNTVMTFDPEQGVW